MRAENLLVLARLHGKPVVPESMPSSLAVPMMIVAGMVVLMIVDTALLACPHTTKSMSSDLRFRQNENAERIKVEVKPARIKKAASGKLTFPSTQPYGHRASTQILPTAAMR